MKRKRENSVDHALIA